MVFGKFITIDLETGKKVLKTLEASLVKYDGSKSVQDVIAEEIARATGVEGELREALEAEIERAGSAEEALELALENLEKELESEIARVVGLINVLESKVDEHIADNVKHITADERTKWNKVITDLATEVSSREQADQQINTELATKAVKTEVQAALDLKANVADLGTAAALNVGKESGNVVKVENDGKIDKSLLPSIAINETKVVNSVEAAMALPVENGDVVIINPEAVIANSEVVNGTFICVNSEADTFEERFRELYSSSDSISKAEVQKLINDEAVARSTKDTELDNAIKAEVAGRKTEVARIEGLVNAEATRAKAAETKLNEDLTNEISRATDAEEQLRTDLTQEVSDREAAINEVKGLVTAEQNRAQGKEAELNTAIENEVNRATAEDARLQGEINKINNVDTGILAKAKEYANLEDAKIEQSLETAKTQLNQSIAGETSARTQAVQGLQAQINEVPGKIADAVRVETEEREAADQALEDRIEVLEESKIDVTGRVETLEETMEIVNGEDSVEGSFRKAVKDLDTKLSSKDAELEGSITNMGAETLQSANDYTDSELDEKYKDLAGQILEEQTQRNADVADLTDKYDKLKADSEEKDIQHKADLDVIKGEGEGSIKKALVDAKAYTDTQVEAEQQRAEAAELVLTNAVKTKADKTALDAEVSRAQTAETKLTEDLAAEVTRSTQAETALSGRINTLDAKVDSNLVTAKSYTDSKFVEEAGLRQAADKELQDAIDAINNETTGILVKAEEHAQGLVTAEESARVEAVNGLRTELTNEINDEIQARQDADEALDERVKVLEARDAEAVVVKYNDGGVTVGDIVKVVDGTANKATLADEFVAGIVVKVADGKASVAVMGKLTMSGLVANKTYFVGTNGMSMTAPTTVGQHIIVLGRATSETDFLLRIEDAIEIKA